MQELALRTGQRETTARETWKQRALAAFSVTLRPSHVPSRIGQEGSTPYASRWLGRTTGEVTIVRSR